MEQNVNATKEIANVDDELASLMAKNEQLQQNENAGDSTVSVDYILLAKTGCQAMKPKSDLYIEGLKIGDFYIQKDKVKLESELKVVPLSFLTIYKEMEGYGANAKFFGIWNKEQASQYDLVDGSYYDRQLPNGHILVPTNWVMVDVIGHPEIENAVIAYKKTGSKIWKDWKKDAKERSGSSATLVYTISEKECENDKNSWTDIGFEFAGSLLEMDKMQALSSLKRSNALREAYEKGLLIGNHNVNATPVQATIEDYSEVEDSEDVDF